MVEITPIDDKAEDDGWKELMGSDLMMKVIDSKKLPSGKSNDIEPKEAVLVSFEGRIAEDQSKENGALFQKAQNWLVIVGDSDVLPALDMGIRFMKVGQTALVWSRSKFALGNGTRTMVGKEEKVPAKSNVMYKVTVTQKVMDTSRLNPYFTIQKALTRKKMANDIYQNEWCEPPETKADPDCEFAMKRAIRLYTKAASEMETLLQGTYFQNVEQDHPQRHECKQILLDSLNNIVAVRLKQKNYHEAKNAAVQVLKIDRNNIKALLRAAKAALMDPASTIEEASAALKAAESAISSSDKMNQKELKRLKIAFKEKQTDYDQKTKEMFSNKLRSRPAAAKQQSTEVTESSSVTSREEQKIKKAVFGEKEIYTLMMRTVVPLLILLLMKYVYDQWGTNIPL